MSSSGPAFGRMLRQLVDLGVITINTEPLDAAIERRLKQFWESTTCPRCGNPSLYTWESSDRVCCRNCPFKPVYTYGTPFHEKHLSCGEVLLAFMLYADTLLNISDIEIILDRAYKTVFYAIREVEAAVHRGFPLNQQSCDSGIYVG
jgi:ribosomal protein S27AE